MSNQTENRSQAPEIVTDTVNIEEYSKRGETPPRARRYVIRIDKQNYTVSVDHMTGRELLKLAAKVPPERFTITQKLRGGMAKTIGLDEPVDFTTPGIERFMTLPLDQTEG